MRVANTGVSCVIDRRGVVAARLEDQEGGTRFAGFKLTEVRPAPAAFPLTFYTRQGDLLPGAAGLAALALFVVLFRLERQAG